LDCSVIHAGEVRHALLAPRRELGEAVLLDVALRVEAERLLDLDLDVEPLAVEPVLVALVEAAQRLVALEDVLSACGPRRGGRPSGCSRDRPVDEAETVAAAVAVDELEEGTLTLPELENVPLERRVIRHRRKRRERLRHAFDSREREHQPWTRRFNDKNPKKGT
jgi:hypothetical protein